MKNTSEVKIDKNSTTRTHWKNLFDYKYLGAQDFEEEDGKYKDMILTIESIYAEEVDGERGPKICTLFSFKEDQPSMIVNKLNFKVIEKVYKTPIAEDLIGMKIQVFVLKNFKAFGKVQDVLRIRPFKPKESNPSLTKAEYPNAIKNFLKSGNLEAVKKHRTISPAQEKEIIELSKAQKDEN